MGKDGYSSAFDQAIVLKQVIAHNIYHNYSSIWMEDFVHPSGRITQMTNTNKLSRFYEGCTGGKTGSTNQAKYCLAVSAKSSFNLIVRTQFLSILSIIFIKLWLVYILVRSNLSKYIA